MEILIILIAYLLIGASVAFVVYLVEPEAIGKVEEGEYYAIAALWWLVVFVVIAQRVDTFIRERLRRAKRIYQQAEKESVK